MPNKSGVKVKNDLKKLIILFFLIILSLLVVTVLVANAFIQKSFCAFDELPTPKEVVEACDKTPWYHFIFSSEPNYTNKTNDNSTIDIPTSLTP